MSGTGSSTGTTANVIGDTGPLNGSGYALTGTWENQGTWTAAAGTPLTQNADTFTNPAGGTWQSAGGTLATNAAWSNAGTITNSGGAVTFGGSFPGGSVSPAGGGAFLLPAGGTIRQVNPGDVLTTGPGVTGTTGTLGLASTPRVAIIDQGAIAVSVVNAAFTLNLGNGSVNLGSIGVGPAAGGTGLTVAGPTWTNAPGGTISAASAALTLGGVGWLHTGTIAAPTPWWPSAGRSPSRASGTSSAPAAW